MMDSSRVAELLERAKAGDTKAFELVIAQYMPMLFAYSRAICGDFHLAQDIVQETALIAFRKLNFFFPEADFPTWLRAIARREALNARKKRTPVRMVNEDSIEGFYEKADSNEEWQRKKALAHCLKLLGGRMGHLVRAHYFEGKRLAEIAATWNQTTTAVKQLLYRARLTLRNCVRQRLVGENL
jgi:RNA polymerase sigma-70 factor, ECF subfamily